MKKEILNDRVTFKDFMNQDYDNIRWYPKFSLKVNNLKENKILCKDIISNIILENDIEFIKPSDNSTFKSDGLIIVPLNGDREIKVKPKSEMTIDLKYNNKKWYDREGNDWSKIIKIDENLDEIYDNEIYRCYPISNNVFEARDFRIEKNKPNNYNVVTNVINLFKFDWMSKLQYNVFYYDTPKYNKEWTSILKNQNNILDRMLLQLNPDDKAKWFDMGCGKNNKIYKKVIEKYSPSYFLGIDNDFNNLLFSLQKYGKCLGRNSYFIPSDLSGDWNDYDKSWYSINFNNKIDYIVCNFSIMHFFTEKFWEQVNLVSKKGTKMLFNLVNDKAKNKINIGDSYMYIENDVVKYFFSHIHESEMKEKYISTEKLYSFLKKFDWIEKKIYTPQVESLESYYTWYIIEKN